MNIKTILFLATAWLIATTSPFDCSAGGQPPTKVYNLCTSVYSGSCTTGALGLNAVGSKVSYPSNLPVTENFGKITAQTTKNLTIPLANADFLKSTRLYAFTPTEGTLIKDKEIKLLIVSFDLTQPLPAWTPLSVKAEATDAKTKYPNMQTMVKVYKQIQGELLWTELGSTYIDTKNLDLTKPLTTKITIQPNAKVAIFLPAHLDDQGNLVAETPLEGDLSKIG